MKKQEREFIRTLNLLREDAESPQLTDRIMERIKRRSLIHIFIKSVLITPLMYLFVLESTRIISKTVIPKLIFSIIPIPEFVLYNPAFFLFTYVLLTSISAAFFVSAYTEGGDANGLLLLSS